MEGSSLSSSWIVIMATILCQKKAYFITFHFIHILKDLYHIAQSFDRGKFSNILWMVNVFHHAPVNAVLLLKNLMG